MGGIITKNCFSLLKDVKKIGFLGFGKSNKALFSFLKERFVFSTVIRDEREEISDAPKDALLLFGKRCFDYAGEDIIFLSPSTRRERPCVLSLAKRGAILSSDAELFFSEAPKNVLAVTGSDGKSTTVAMSQGILAKSGKKCFACGNFGLPLTPLLENEDAFFIAELSSFMLRYLCPRTRRALITNVTPNHLNWHKDFEEYVAAKEEILKNTDECVLPFDDQITKNMSKKHGTFALFSTELGFDDLKQKGQAELYYTTEGGVIFRNGVPLMSLSEIKIPGLHNVKNTLAALALTDGFADVAAARHAISAFGGLEHRCKLVANRSGVSYYDSSIDSTPTRTAATLELFSSPVTVILGGKDKGVGYEPLKPALYKHAGAVILCGENAERLGEFLKDTGLSCPIFYADDYIEAVSIAANIGYDTVLSPAATSYDRFLNFEQRGLAFAHAVKELL